jgi:hypothetical protein
MMNDHWKASIGVLVVFILGCFAGGLCASAYFAHRTMDFIQRGPVAFVDILDHRLGRRLKLDADQKLKLHQYLLENLEKRKQLQKQIRPQIRMVNEQTVEEITTMLRPEQAALFHENLLNVRPRIGTTNGQPENNDAVTNSVGTPAGKSRESWFVLPTVRATL